MYEDAIGIAGKDNPESQAQQREALQMISKLPEKLRDAVILVHWQGLTHKEAAEVLDISENTVSWRLHEVRKYFNDTGKEAHHG